MNMALHEGRIYIYIDTRKNVKDLEPPTAWPLKALSKPFKTLYRGGGLNRCAAKESQG